MLKTNFFKLKATVVVLMFVSATGCKKNADVNQSAESITSSSKDNNAEVSTINETPAFQSNFQGSTAVVFQSSTRDDITGTDAALTSSNWVTTLEGYKYFTTAYINYEAGTNAQRKADVIADPTPGAPSGNKVLSFKITESHISSNPNKGRVQFDLENRTKTPRATEYRQSIRMYLGPDFNVLTADSYFPGSFDWLTLFEFWNQPTWRSTNSGRIGVNLTRINHTGPLRFELLNENMKDDPRTNIWPRDIRSTYTVPIGQWMTITLYIKDGEATGSNIGRFQLKCKVDGGTETVIFDKTGETNHPSITGDGMSSWNPMKLYCSEGVLNKFKNAGKPMQIYWDNLRIYTN